MLFDFGAVGLFVLVGIAFIYGTLVLGHFVRPSRYEPQKKMIYECGEPSVGSAWIRYNIRFYTIALVYLIFDVEVIFLFPVALVLKEFKANGLGALALMEIIFFALILLVGLAYAWRYGNLDWIRASELQDPDKGQAQVVETAQEPVAAVVEG